MGMTRRQAQRARHTAIRLLAYRAWALDATTGAIPSVDILTDTRLHHRQFEWSLRRAQNGLFDAPRVTVVV